MHFMLLSKKIKEKMLQTCSALPALYHFHYKLNWYHYYDFLLNWEVFVVNLWGDYSNIEHQHDLLAYKLLDGDDVHDVNDEKNYDYDGADESVNADLEIKV